MKFELHSIESAPEAVKAELETAQQAYSSIPNLYRGFASNPATLKIYLAFNENLQEFGCLSTIEQQVVYLTSSAENGCTYCVGAHSVLADMSMMPEQTLFELRDQKKLSDPKLNALRNITLSIMEHRGWVPEKDIMEFQNMGYEQPHLLEVLTILAQKTLSNYFNHLAQTPLDKMFESRVWDKKEQA
ncbi:MAG: carboxymuconolactone decarboxylase family protein [Pseudomonadota bacterium]